MSQSRCRSGSPATEPSGPGAKLDPPDHTQSIPAPPWTQGANTAKSAAPGPSDRAAGLTNNRAPPPRWASGAWGGAQRRRELLVHRPT
jgi:hypothetical protein